VGWVRVNNGVYNSVFFGRSPNPEIKDIVGVPSTIPGSYKQYGYPFDHPGCTDHIDVAIDGAWDEAWIRKRI